MSTPIACAMKPADTENTEIVSEVHSASEDDAPTSSSRKRSCSEILGRSREPVVQGMNGQELCDSDSYVKKGYVETSHGQVHYRRFEIWPPQPSQPFKLKTLQNIGQLVYT